MRGSVNMLKIGQGMQWTVALIAGICATIAAWWMPFLGDDLSHSDFIREAYPNFYQLPRMAASWVLHVNGRFGDILGNILLAFSPKWLFASLVGVMTVLFYILPPKLAGLRASAPFLSLFFMALLMFSMPWWDSFFLFVCRMNYLWVSVWVMGFLWMIFSERVRSLSLRWQYLLIPVAFFIGWGHEAAGMPIVCGIIIYWWLNRRNKKLFPVLIKRIIIAFCIGAMITVFSPGVLSRLANERTPDDPLIPLLLKSSFYVLLLILIVLCLMISAGGRKRIYELVITPWTIFAVGALGSMMFVAVGGVVGRSGWFSQVYALIALFIIARGYFDKKKQPDLISYISSLLLLIIMIIFQISVCRLQVEAEKSLCEIEEIYRNSEDGIVYANPKMRSDFPWWALNIPKAAVDNDDYSLLSRYDEIYGSMGKRYRLLPAELRNFKFSEGEETVEIGKGYVVKRMPQGCIEEEIPGHGAKFLPSPEGMMTVVDFTVDSGDTLYYVSPREVDPGDR